MGEDSSSKGGNDDRVGGTITVAERSTLNGIGIKNGIPVGLRELGITVLELAGETETERERETETERDLGF